MEYGLAISERIPSQADARLGQKLGAIHGESGIAHEGIGFDDAVIEGVIRSAAVGLISFVGGFEAEAGADSQIAAQLDDILHEPRGFPRVPTFNLIGRPRGQRMRCGWGCGA